jgi:signal transduction histidine kinase
VQNNPLDLAFWGEAGAAMAVFVVLAVVLYHITQEALNNVLKHAKAPRVRVCLQFLEAVTYLEVCDDGIGFDPVTVRERGGLGLAGIQERVQRIGGLLQVNSAPGKGTRVAVEVPVTGEYGTPRGI